MVDRVERGGGLSQLTPKSEDDSIVAGGGWTTRTVIVERRELRPRADAWRRLMVLLAPFTVVSGGLALATLIIGDDHGRLTLFGLSAWGLVATAGGLLAAQLASFWIARWCRAREKPVVIEQHEQTVEVPIAETDPRRLY